MLQRLGSDQKRREKLFLPTINTDVVRQSTFARASMGPKASPMLSSAVIKFVRNGRLANNVFSLHHNRPVRNWPFGSLTV